MLMPLQDVTVLDLSRVLAGPWATQLLADLGATVLKIERPGQGDDTRSWGPPYLDSPDGSAQVAAYFLAANRGKQSVAIDIAAAEGARLVAELAGHCDVLIENFKVGGLARYGLDPATLRARHPRLVYCSITGFGQDGPYAPRAGYDFIIQGMSGLMSVTGDADGSPTKAGVAVVDLFTGLYAANAIQAALRLREMTGTGQHIDMALMDVQMATMANQAMNYLVSGRSPGRLGNAHPNIVPYQAFDAADGALTVAVGNDAQFENFCRVLGVPTLAHDPRFRTNACRIVHRDTLVSQLQEILLRGEVQEWLDKLEQAGVPAGPINTMAQAFADRQVVHRGVRTRLQHADLGPVPGVRCPIRMSDAAIGSQLPPPLLGADTGRVLAKTLGLDDAALQGLKARGII